LLEVGPSKAVPVHGSSGGVDANLTTTNSSGITEALRSSVVNTAQFPETKVASPDQQHSAGFVPEKLCGENFDKTGEQESLQIDSQYNLVGKKNHNFEATGDSGKKMDDVETETPGEVVIRPYVRRRKEKLSVSQSHSDSSVTGQ